MPDADVPVNGTEVLALYLTPGPIPLEGIEVKVVGLSELDWRPVGTSQRAFIGPGEIEDLRDRYLSLVAGCGSYHWHDTFRRYSRGARADRAQTDV